MLQSNVRTSARIAKRLWQLSRRSAPVDGMCVVTTLQGTAERRLFQALLPDRARLRPPLFVALLAQYHGLCLVKRSRALLASTPTRDNQIRAGESPCRAPASMRWGVFLPGRAFTRSCHASENARLYWAGASTPPKSPSARTVDGEASEDPGRAVPLARCRFSQNTARPMATVSHKWTATSKTSLVAAERSEAALN
jgi:hypothetical protein